MFESLIFFSLFFFDKLKGYKDILLVYQNNHPVMDGIAHSVYHGGIDSNLGPCRVKQAALLSLCQITRVHCLTSNGFSFGM